MNFHEMSAPSAELKTGDTWFPPKNHDVPPKNIKPYQNAKPPPWFLWNFEPNLEPGGIFFWWGLFHFDYKHCCHSSPFFLQANPFGSTGVTAWECGPRMGTGAGAEKNTALVAKDTLEKLRICLGTKSRGQPHRPFPLFPFPALF